LKNKLTGKKLLICVPYTYPFYAGGGRNALNFAQSLFEKNVDVCLLALNQNFSLPVKSKIGQVPVYRIPYIKYNIITKIFSLLFIISYYLFFIAKSEIIMIYGNNNILYELIIFLGKLFNKKVIFRSTMLKDDDISSLINTKRFLKQSRKRMFRALYGYYSLSPKFTESFLNISDDRSIIFESSQGVDSKLFSPVSSIEKKGLLKKLNLPEDTIIIISAGYLIKRKGYEQIFKVLSKVDLPFLYIIVGDYQVQLNHYLSSKNNEMQYLYQTAIKMMGNKILFTGPKENINEYMQVSDIFLINSKKEGLPNALLEAMACGVCTVSNNLAGLQDYILFDKINSLIFNNESEMQYSINELITNSDLREKISQNAKRFINENCSLDKVTEKFMSRFIG
jgi:glycosyltransferase involved in cell wall biosynthesis